MKIERKELKTESDISLFGELKCRLMKEHQKYANKLGIYDKYVDEYTCSRAIRHIDEEGFTEYLILHNNKPIGILETQLIVSEIDNENVLFITSFYIVPEERGQGIGTKVMKDVIDNSPYRIELECWYEMPANKLYERLGMKPIMKYYMIKQ